MWKVILNEAIRVTDFKVVKGHRGEEEQTHAYVTGASQVDWPDSKHNSIPSMGVDLAPYPIDWKDLKRFYILYGVIKAIAFQHGVKITCGVEWGWDEGHYQLEVA
jgi:hypothetical protein